VRTLPTALTYAVAYIASDFARGRYTIIERVIFVLDDGYIEFIMEGGQLNPALCHQKEKLLEII
jgi:hypothetical protein